jgi:DNA-binding transcriptional LysR family regulator
LRFTEAEPPDAIRMLRAGRVDVALLFSYPEADSAAGDGLRHVPIAREPICLVVPHGVPGDRLRDHKDRSWIGGCERCREHLLRTCGDAGFVPDIAFTTDDYVAVQALVAAGLGVTTLPALALSAQRHPAVRVIRLPRDYRSITVAVLGAAPDPPPTAQLIDQLRRAAREWLAHDRTLGTSRRRAHPAPGR